MVNPDGPQATPTPPSATPLPTPRRAAPSGAESRPVQARPTKPAAATTSAPRMPRTGATRVRGRAMSVIRPSGPPTKPISVRGTNDRVSEWHTRSVIDFCLRLGEAMLVTGASVADTTASLLRVGRAYGLQGAHVDITYTSVTISMHRGVHRDPITVMRIITHFGTDYSRLEALHALVRDIARDPDDPGEIDDNLYTLERILEQPHVYRRGVITFAWALMGAGVAMLLGGSTAMVLVAGLSTAVVDRIQYAVARAGVSAFFGQMLGAMFATAVAVGLLVVHQHAETIMWLGQVRPSLVVASSVVVLLAGMSVVTAAQDTLDGFYLTAGARTYEVVLLTGGVVAGVLLVLSIAQRFGVDLVIIERSSSFAGSVLTQIVAAALIAGAFAVSAYCAPRTVLAAVLTGGFSWLLFGTLMWGVGTSEPVAAGGAALVVGALAPFVGTRVHVPSIALITAGIVPLLPGQAVYRGIMMFITEGENTLWQTTLLNAVLMGLTLSVGVSLGTLLGRQVSAGADSLTARVVRRTVSETTNDTAA